MRDEREVSNALAHLCKDLPSITRTLRGGEPDDDVLAPLLQALLDGSDVHELHDLVEAVDARLRYRSDARGLLGRSRTWAGTAADGLPGPHEVEFRCPLERCSYTWKRGDAEEERRCAVSGRWPRPGPAR